MVQKAQLWESDSNMLLIYHAYPQITAIDLFHKSYNAPIHIPKGIIL